MNHYQTPVDKLASMLKPSGGHIVWGWVVYRGTYSSDSEWAEFMEKLKTETRDILDEFGATEAVKNQHGWTVIEDRGRLDNATKSDVRRMFSEWVDSPEAAAELPHLRVSPMMVGMARYQFCIHVDQASLRSVLDDADDWHVNIINRSWVSDEDGSDDDESESGSENGFTEEERERIRLADIWLEIEGCTEVRFCEVLPRNSLFLTVRKGRCWVVQGCDWNLDGALCQLVQHQLLVRLLQAPAADKSLKQIAVFARFDPTCAIDSFCR